MSKSRAVLALAFVSAPVLAGPVEPFDYVREGERIVGTSETTADGQRLVGRNLSTGDRFVLVVKDDRVVGRYGADQVRFAIAQRR